MRLFARFGKASTLQRPVAESEVGSSILTDDSFITKAGSQNSPPVFIESQDGQRIHHLRYSFECVGSLSDLCDSIYCILIIWQLFHNVKSFQVIDSFQNHFSVPIEPNQNYFVLFGFNIQS